MQPKHQKITNYSRQDDATIKIETKSYYEKLTQEMEEIEQVVLTTIETLRQDVDKSIDHVLVDKASQLVITVKIQDGKPKLVKRWVTFKKNYNRM